MEQWAPTIITLISVIFGAGAIFGRIKDQEKTLLSHDNRLNKHDLKLSEHDTAIAVAVAFRQGYDAGKDGRLILPSL